MSRRTGKAKRIKADALEWAEDTARRIREHVHSSDVSLDDPRAAEISRAYGEHMRRVHETREAYKRRVEGAGDGTATT